MQVPDPIIEIVNNIATVTVDEGDNAIINIGLEPTPEIIEIGVIGPQGPIGGQGPPGPEGPTGPAALSDLTDVDAISKVDKSVLVWNQSTGKFTANDQNTTITLTDGGNF
jgi:hypothetical protein